MTLSHLRQGSRAIFLVMLSLSFFLSACEQPLTSPDIPDPAQSSGTKAGFTPVALPSPALSWLTVQAEPEGAAVSIDGAVSGTSPVTLTVRPGVHRVEVGSAGYMSVSDVITFAAGEQAIYSPRLEDVVAPMVAITSTVGIVGWTGQTEVRASATDGAGVAHLQVKAGDTLLGEADAAEVLVNLELNAIPGLTAGQVFTLTATATDPAGNTGQATLALVAGAEGGMGPVAEAQTTAQPATAVMPAATQSPATATPEPLPEPTADPAEIPTIDVTTISLPTYPYAAYLRDATDPALGNYPFKAFDRDAYQNSNPKPAPQTYTLVVMENRYLRLSLLPDLGGRLYECVFKPTGNDELYKNQVIKPTQWGPGTPDHPEGANWWIAAGGIEWGFPVEEHGYEFGTKWGYDPIHLPDGTAMVTVFTRDHNRPYAVVDIMLAPERRVLHRPPTHHEPAGHPVRLQVLDRCDDRAGLGQCAVRRPALHLPRPADDRPQHGRRDLAGAGRGANVAGLRRAGPFSVGQLEPVARLL